MLVKTYALKIFLSIWLRKTLCSNVHIDTILVILPVSVSILIDSRFPKCECNNGMLPITKFVFKLICNSNIFHAFRKVIASFRHSRIEAIKVLRISFCENWVVQNLFLKDLFSQMRYTNEIFACFIIGNEELLRTLRIQFLKYWVALELF